MATQAIESLRNQAEVFYGDEICQEKCQEFLREIDLPNGLLPLESILEVGYNKTAGFVWLKQKKATIHVFKSIGKTVSYAQEITAFVEKHKMTKVTGVKSKEILIWITIGEIYVDEKNAQKLVLKNPITGISKSFPISAFQLEEKKNGEGGEKM